MAYGELGLYINTGMGKFMGSKQWRDFAYKNSGMLKGRLQDPAVKGPFLQDLEKSVSGITALTEQVHVGGAFLGAYFKAIEKLGYDEKKAIAYADVIARRTQTDYKPYAVNAWMRSNSGKLLSMFQIWTFNSMNHVLYDLGAANIPEDMASLFTENKTNRTRWGAFMSFVAGALVINEIYKHLGLREPEEPGAFVPSVSGMTMARYRDIGPVAIAKDVVQTVFGKTKKAKIKGAVKAVASLVPGGAQAIRFMQGTVFPKTEKKKRFSIRD
jgi:hypothetical protein